MNKKLVLWSVMASLAACTASVTAGTNNPHQIASDMVKVLSEGLPLQLDEHTTVTHAQAVGPYIVRNYTIDYVFESGKLPYFAEFFKDGEEEHVCTIPNMKWILSTGVVMAYNVYDKNNQLITSFNIDNKVCTYY